MVVMSVLVLYNGSVLGSRVKVADTFSKRFIGLMGKESLGKGEGLLLKNCRFIHSFFMRMSIDAVYLSKGMEVIYIETLRPWRIGKYVRGAAHVLELAAGAAGVKVGDVLDMY
jgi:uncharacterized protein